MKTGVYVETLEPEILIEQDVKGILAEFGCDVGMGFDLPYGGISGERAAYYDRYLRAMDVLRESGVRLFLWPLARKNDGYWLNEKNVDVFSAGLESFSEYAQRAGVGVPGFIYDIETPWNQGTVFTAAAKNPIVAPFLFGKLMLENRNPVRFRRASLEMAEMKRKFESATETSYTAVLPFCLEDLAAGGNKLQDILETPVFTVPWDHFNVMVYNSYLPVWFSFAFDRLGGARLVYEYSVEIEAARPGRVAFTFGSTWEGILPGNSENIFRTPEELAPDIAAAKAAGVDNLWLYCLEGILFEDFKLTNRRKPAESAAWFEIFHTTRPLKPEPSPRLNIARNLARTVLFDPLAALSKP